MSDLLTSILLGAGGTAAGGLGGLLSGLLSGKSWQGTYENINQDYASNPIWQALFGSSGESGGGLYNQLLGSATDPTSFWRQFMGAQGDVSSLIGGATGSVKSAMQSNLSDFVKQATSETAQELSGLGSVYSGALGSISGEKIGQEASKAGVDLATLQAQMQSGLWSSLLGGLQGNQSNQMSLLNSILGLGGQMSSPTYAYESGISDLVTQGMGLGGQLTSGIASIFKALTGGKAS